MPKKRTNEEFVELLRVAVPSIIPLELYKGANTPIMCRCIECNFEWLVKPSHLLNLKHGCPNCAGNIRYDNDAFVAKLSSVLPSIEPLEDYKGSNKEKILCRCNNCGNEWRVRPDTLLRGHGCRICASKEQGERQRKNKEVFAEELHYINPNILLLEDYKQATTTIRVKCALCGYEWYAKPNNLLNGSGCFKCSHTQTSRIEQIIYTSFKFLLGEGEAFNRDNTAIGKELDIYVPRINLAIEFGAWYWHKDKIDNDLSKQRLCKKKGISLLFIYEGCSKEANRVLRGINAICYEQVLSSEKDYLSVKEILKDICKRYSLDGTALDEYWEQIVKESLKQAQKKGEASFIERLRSESPTIQYVSGYIDQQQKVLVHCSVCNNEWKTLPYVLLSGCGCPKCKFKEIGIRNRLTQEEVVSRIKVLYPELTVVGNYEGKDKKIDVICNNCENAWSVRAGNLMRGLTHCPFCHPKNKSVECIETNTVYQSIHEANRKTGIDRRAIKSCCEMPNRTAGKYHWRYFNE